MEAHPVSWATANFNLIWHYNNKNINQQRQQVNNKPRVTHNNDKKCMQFNSPTGRCPLSSRVCQYKHECNRCSQPDHPTYLCSAGRAAVGANKFPNSGNRAAVAMNSGYLNQVGITHQRKNAAPPANVQKSQ